MIGRYNTLVMSQQEPGPVHAPEFPPNVTWLQGGPLKLAELRGRPVLIDFWDYTCVNCRALPYVSEWHRRYGSLGLTVVGVHAPGRGRAADRVRGGARQRLRDVAGVHIPRVRPSTTAPTPGDDRPIRQRSSLPPVTFKASPVMLSARQRKTTA